MPQNDNLSAKWREDLGPDWQRVHETRLHTLGNLTLTGYNSEYSDRPFVEKRDMKGGFKESPLRLNEGLATIDFLERSSHRQPCPATRVRCHRCLGSARPQQLTSRHVSSQKSTEELLCIRSTIIHILRQGTTSRELFEVLRKELLALDPCVTEEFLKFYVAYKAETNFVDVVPQASAATVSQHAVP